MKIMEISCFPFILFFLYDLNLLCLVWKKGKEIERERNKERNGKKLLGKKKKLKKKIQEK